LADVAVCALALAVLFWSILQRSHIVAELKETLLRSSALCLPRLEEHG